MGISYIPGAEATLGPALAQLTQAAGQLIDPNFEFRRRFTQALATNPQLLQELADVEFASGGAVSRNLGKLLSPEAFAAITGTRPSAKAVAERSLAEALPSVTGVPVSELPEEPTLAQIGAIRATTGARPGELEQEGAESRLRRLALGYIGSLTPERQQQLGTFVTFPQIMADEHFLAQLDFQERMFRLRNVDRINDSIIRMREANAIWWQQHTGVGTAEDWSDYFSGRAAKRLEKLKGGETAEFSPADARLLELDEAFQQAPAERRALILNRIDLGLTRGIESVQEARSDSERAARLAGLNQLLQERARMGAPRLQAKWAPPKAAETPVVGALLRPFKALRFFDEEGNEVDPSAATAPIELPQARTRAAAPAPTTAPVPAPTRTREQLWDEFRRQMFPNVPAGQLTPQQVQAIIARVNAEQP